MANIVMLLALSMASFFSALLMAEPLPPAPPPPSPAASFCTPVTGDMANLVEILRGKYRVLGMRASTTFTGELDVDGAEGTGQVTISGRRDGKAVRGTARYVHCGPDRVRRLEVVLQAKGATQGLFCVPHSDYDNFTRMSCSSSLSDPNGDMELWQQKIVPES